MTLYHMLASSENDFVSDIPSEDNKLTVDIRLFTDPKITSQFSYGLPQ